MSLDKNELIKLAHFFLHDFEKDKFGTVLFYQIISLGLYSFFWIYKTNKMLEKIDGESPESKRSMFVLFVIPVFWFLIGFFTNKYLFLNNVPTFFHTINIVMWSLIIFLSLQYLYDFSKSYAKLTETHPLIWYLLLYSGYLATILHFFNFNFLLFLVFVPILTIPSMQEILNITAREVLRTSQKNHFIHKERMA